MKTIVVILLLALAAPAYGRIGQAEQQIETLLGKPFRVLEDGRKIYASGVFNVAVTYENGVSELELYVKRDHSALTSGERADLLRLNAGPVPWINLNGNGWVAGNVQYWSPDNPRTRAGFYNEKFRYLVISSQRFMWSHATKLGAVDI
jgi:hypothetical protein